MKHKVQSSDFKKEVDEQMHVNCDIGGCKATWNVLGMDIRRYDASRFAFSHFLHDISRGIHEGMHRCTYTDADRQADIDQTQANKVGKLTEKQHSLTHTCTKGDRPRLYQTDKQTDRQTDRQADGQTDRQTDIKLINCTDARTEQG